MKYGGITLKFILILLNLLLGMFYLMFVMNVIQNIIYNGFNKVSTIDEGVYHMQFTYGKDQGLFFKAGEVFPTHGIYAISKGN